MFLTTHSSTSTLRACPQKYKRAYEDGIRPERDAEPLRVGSSYHELREVEAAPHYAVKALVERYASSIPDWTDFDTWMTEANMVGELFLGRVAQGFDYTVLATELPFELRVGSARAGYLRGVRNAGKMDKVVRLPDGRVAVMEIKTTQDDISPGSDYWSKLRLNTQISRYLDAAQRAGFPEAETVLYDVTRKPGIKPKNLDKKSIKTITEQGTYCGVVATPTDRHMVTQAALAHPDKKTVPKIRETATLFGLRLREEVTANPERYYQTMEIPRLDDDLEYARRRIVQDVKEIRLRRKHGLWQKNESACTAMGRCPYLDLCSNGIDTTNFTPPGFKKLDSPHPELELNP